MLHYENEYLSAQKYLGIASALVAIMVGLSLFMLITGGGMYSMNAIFLWGLFLALTYWGGYRSLETHNINVAIPCAFIAAIGMGGLGFLGLFADGSVGTIGVLLGSAVLSLMAGLKLSGVKRASDALARAKQLPGVSDRVGGSVGVSDLERLVALRNQGHISDDEFQRMKDNILKGSS